MCCILDSETMSLCGFTRKELFFLLKGNLNDQWSEIYKTVENDLSRKQKYTVTLNEKYKLALRSLVQKIRDKWQQVNRTEEKFLTKFDDWLGVFVVLVDKVDSIITPETSKTGMGRPASNFLESSERTKRRKTEDIRKERSSDELVYATQMSLRAEKKLDAAFVLKDITSCSLFKDKTSLYRNSLKIVQEEALSQDEALSLLIETRLSKHQYQLLQQTSRGKKCKLFPHYSNVLQAKKRCYPKDTEITITESKASVTLQALLDHTVDRILSIQAEAVEALPSDTVCNLELKCKWGCDGTSSQRNYKQKFIDGECNDDSKIFFTSLVPLELSFVNQESSVKNVVWKNPRPSSTRFCRPISIQFLHETPEVTRKNVDAIKEEEKNLLPHNFSVNGKEFCVIYKLFFTMVDGKVCNSVANVSSAMRCYLCHATSKMFNKIDKILELPVLKENLEFGISSLHAWIRFFECCLHLSYRLFIEKWKIFYPDDKKSVEERKKLIQKRFREELGLIVDQPRQGGGTSNDGNTARRFFENSTISADITGIDEDLIKRFHVVLQTISCGLEVNVTKFQDYALETARYFVQLYPWFYMPTSVHKILIHGYEIIESMLLPIGQMSEEAQESCNKFIRSFREDFARKFSRKTNMEDIFQRLLVASDPLISSLRRLPVKKLKSLSPEAIELLVFPDIPEDPLSLIESENDESDSDSSSAS